MEVTVLNMPSKLSGQCGEVATVRKFKHGLRNFAARPKVALHEKDFLGKIKIHSCSYKVWPLVEFRV